MGWRRFAATVLTGFLVWHSVAAAEAAGQSVAPGRYIAVGDWATLVVKKTPDGPVRFEIDAVGANCHVCTLSGVVLGNIAVADGAADPGASAPCRISLQRGIAGVSVTPVSGESCRDYCGMRADFAGLYKLPPAACTQKQQAARRAGFLSLYRAKKFAEARESLESLLAECREFLNWIEIDKVRNDLALAQYRAGDARACLMTLAETRAGKVRNEDELGLLPCDNDSYIATARATWHNQKLCGRGDASR